eukprot:1704845-Rhodomonas_salina.3
MAFLSLLVRARYARSAHGTDIADAYAHIISDVRYCDSICLPSCYTMSGTEIAYHCRWGSRTSS